MENGLHGRMWPYSCAFHLFIFIFLYFIFSYLFICLFPSAATRLKGLESFPRRCREATTRSTKCSRLILFQLELRVQKNKSIREMDGDPLVRINSLVHSAEKEREKKEKAVVSSAAGKKTGLDVLDMMVVLVDEIKQTKLSKCHYKHEE